MNSRAARQLLVAALLVLGAYAGIYFLIEHSRLGKGPWEVTFLTDGAGRPSVRVMHKKLNLQRIEFRFNGEHLDRTNFQSLIVYDRPITNTPFGSVMFIDTTFLPGTVTFDFFGHEVQLLRRVLIVNKRDVPWQPELIMELKQAEKLPIEFRKKLRRAEPKLEPARQEN